MTRAVFPLMIWLLFSSADSRASATEQSKAQAIAQSIAQAAYQQIGVTRLYDPSYQTLSYPGGDVPAERGVCTDVVIRALRSIGLDLQLLVHEDMRADFSAYPQHWGLSRPDRNIDHRRVPNLMTYFSAHHQSLLPSTLASDYLPGDIVAWLLPHGAWHIGLVASQRSRDGQRPLIIHNIGAGAQLEDVLFAYTVKGHYRIQAGSE